MQAKWLIADLKKLARDNRRLIRHRYTDVLTPAQRANLHSTCQDAVNAIEELKHKIKRGGRRIDKMAEEKTVQELQFELMVRASFNNFNGEQVVADLKANPELWLGTIMGGVGANEADLIALRDIKDNRWVVAALYILCLKDKAKELRKLALKWNADEINWLRAVHSKIGDWTEESKDYKILSLWWD